MKIGIIGAGNVGATIAALAAQANNELVISNDGPPEALRDLAEKLGAMVSAGTPAEAARFGEIVLEAIPYGEFPTLPVKDLEGKVLISASNYLPGRDGDIDFGGHTETELVAEHLEGAMVVKAFNTIWFEDLEKQGDTGLEVDERRAIFLASDHDTAKIAVSNLISEIGFGPVDTGSLREGGRIQEPGSEFFNLDITRGEAMKKLGLARPT